MNGLNPSGTAEHLRTLDSAWDQLMTDLRVAQTLLRQRSRAKEEAYATHYIGAPYTASNDSMRKQYAVLHTLYETELFREAEDEVEFVRAQLRALAAKSDIARSLHAGTRQATQ